MAKYKNRIVGSGEEALDQIMFNPRNWRTHPKHQQDALKGVLEEIGWVQQVIVNKQTGNLIDGHLRCQLSAREGQETIPVLYIDVTEDEEKTILSTLDPIGAMAETDKPKLEDLFEGIKSDNQYLNQAFEDIARKEDLFAEVMADSGRLLDLVDITIDNPDTQVSHFDVIRLGDHILVIANPMDEWEYWSQYMESGMLLATYPGMFSALVEGGKRLLLIQPDTYIAGHIIDRYAEVYGDDSIEFLKRGS